MNSYVLLYEDFQEFAPPLNEGLAELIEWLKQLSEKKQKLKEKMASAMLKNKDSQRKLANFKEKANKTKDPISKKIYTNRAFEEGVSQQIHSLRMKIFQIQEKLIDSQIRTAELRKKKADTGSLFRVPNSTVATKHEGCARCGT